VISDSVFSAKVDKHQWVPNTPRIRYLFFPRIHLLHPPFPFLHPFPVKAFHTKGPLFSELRSVLSHKLGPYFSPLTIGGPPLRQHQQTLRLIVQIGTSTSSFLPPESLPMFQIRIFGQTPTAWRYCRLAPPFCPGSAFVCFSGWRHR